jgi:uncharacterized protein
MTVSATATTEAEGGAPRARHRPGERVRWDSLPATTTIPTIDLDITNGCNLKCSYCFKNLDEPDNMSVETAKDAFEWLVRAAGPSDTVRVNFMGGEPMLRYKAMREIVSWGRRRGRLCHKDARP